MAQVSKRGVRAWMLADWAGQPFHTLCITFVFAPYFVEFGLGGGDQAQATWGYMTGTAALIVAVLAPILGAMADVSGPRKPWIAGLSALHVLAVAALWLGVPGMDEPMIVLLAFALALITTELAFIFLNAMLPDLGSESEIGRISGSAWAMGYLGGLVSLILVLGLMAGDPETGLTMLGIAPILGLDPAMGEGSRAAGPFSAIWYTVFIIPLFLFTPDVKRKPVAVSARRGLQELARMIGQLPKRPSLMTFLLSSMLYRDALAALYAFAGIYAAGVLGIGIIELGAFGILATVTGALGAWVGGRFDSRLGPKPVVVFCTASLALFSLTLTLTTATSFAGVDLGPDSGVPTLVFFGLGALIGAAGGALQASSRSLMVRQASDPAVMTQSFGLYGLAGKATAFLGLFLIGFVTDVTSSQRLGVTPVVGLFVLGLVLLIWVRPKGDMSRA
ncbi:MFS transporter [Pontivivens nitratireducens]|uniref:MFS transporter n=1 Tax=Pontivivens nitratireducens TaxID=2758038 RepID=A0A6G7VLX2_9RHOB|nr:MFS transporter [Pontibrevibacter nitratireducens]QIK40932.1 MFS transporter [Pontibrevibacter nitratireducens]